MPQRTDVSWNPLRGWSRLTSPGYTTGEVRLLEQDLLLPLHWKKPRRVFVGRRADLFHESVPDLWLLQVFDIMRQCPQHTFQLLTERAERMADFCQRLRWDGQYYEKRPRHLPLELRTSCQGGVLWLADTADGPGYRLMGGGGCTGMTWVQMGTKSSSGIS